MSHKGNHKRGGGPQHKPPSKRSRPIESSTTTLTPIQGAFTEYAQQLDARHAQRDRIITATRDLTQRSKKVISLLQRITTPESCETIGKQAHNALTDIARFLFTIHTQLADPTDYYRLHRHYTGGIQEFIEALSFHHYLQHHTLITKHEIETFVNTAATVTQNNVKEITTEDTSEMKAQSSIPPFFVSEADYLNGILDLGGELMRFATNSLTLDYRAGTPGVTATRVCRFIVSLYDAIISCNGMRIGYEKKAQVLLESAMKCEQLCYKLFLRGNELPPHMLTSLLNENTSHDDNDDDG